MFALAYHTNKPHAVHQAFGYTHAYDDNGNLTSRSKGTEAWTLRYAGFDKPRWMTKTDGPATVGSEFLYNANRSRVIQLEYSGVDGSGVPSQYVRKRVYGLGPVLEANYDHVGGANPWSLKKVRLYVAIPACIKQVEDAGSYRGAEAVVSPLVPYFASFTKDEVMGFLAATLGNSQVWDAALCKTEYLPAFARQHWAIIPKKVRRDLLTKLEMKEREIAAA